MLPTTLNTNEVKNSAGTEVEFQHIGYGPGRQSEYKAILETPAAKHRISVRHTEIGSGVELRRRSNIQVLKTVAGASGIYRQVIFNQSVDIPVGDLAVYDEVKNVIAEGMSLLASQGASTTILYDCSGYGADALVNGSI
jgi:hypothetical protein